MDNNTINAIKVNDIIYNIRDNRVDANETILAGFGEGQDFTTVKDALDTKVDVADGYRLMSDAEGTKLGGIADGAQVNVIESVKLNGVALEVAKDKSVDVTAIEGVAEGEKVIMLGEDKKISTNLSIVYDSDAKEIKLMSGTEKIGEAIDATDFIKDGMVDSAVLEERTEGEETKTYLVISFNADGGDDTVEVDVTKLLNIKDINDLKRNMIDKGKLDTILDGYGLTGSPSSIKNDLNTKEDKPYTVDLNITKSLNELIYSGKYIISGRLRQDIHSDFPIITYGNINAELTVYNNLNGYISQFIKFDNINGGDCNLYTRVCQNEVWENWQKIQGVNEVNLIGGTWVQGNWFDTGKTYDNFTESGMYTGVYGYRDGYNAYYETFVLIVINDNLYDSGISQLKYSLYPSKTKSTAVNIQKRFGVKNNDGSITWLGWKNIIDDSIYNVEKNLEITNEELNKITDKDLIEGVITDGTNIFKDLFSLPSTINNGIQDLPNGTFFKLKAFNNIKQLEFIKNNNSDISISDNYKKYFQRGEIICTSILGTTTICIYEIQRQGTLVDGAIQWDKWELTNNSATNA